ncbi:MAG TPA: adenylyltransferase/cytidyltransferase family protein [Candidatus Acidoferrales bacterium]|nr:adenylyltransferase/cytidyltransferase family protein [Candidatus Acidoferrales bacterium]
MAHYINTLFACSSTASLARIEMRIIFRYNIGKDDRVGQIVSPDNLIELRKEWRRDAKRVVLAAGAFDLLHPGHIRLLEQARSLGDVLVVAVEDDAALRAAEERPAKNPAGRPLLRPVVPLEERAEILAALSAVDFVTGLRNIPVGTWIERFVPDIYVQGGSTSGAKRAQTAPHDQTDAGGPSLVSIPLEPGYSTAQLIERIQQSRQ